LTRLLKTETVQPLNRVGVMADIRAAAVMVVLAGALSLPAVAVMAQNAPAGIRLAQAGPPDAAPRPARRPPTRLRVHPRYEEPWRDEVYPQYFPGPNAVRECSTAYVQEYRPSGTVIVPRINCHWRRG
jgi:hypothetical protein